MRLLRFFTCGEVDDGKSTLIGRLFCDTGQIPDDLLASMKGNLAHYTDGLKAEREQNITVDAAYRFFEDEDSKFIVADAPGHLPYLRQMVSAASTADAAIILVDATRGVSDQTLRHAHICQWLGIRSIAFAINKMDAVAWSEEHFKKIKHSLSVFTTAHFFPISALHGDNVASTSLSASWYQGSTLLQWMKKLTPQSLTSKAVRFPIQLVQPNGRALGTLASGILVSQQTLTANTVNVHVEKMWQHINELKKAEAGQPLSLQLTGQPARGTLLHDGSAHTSKRWRAQWIHFKPTRGLIAHRLGWVSPIQSLAEERTLAIAELKEGIVEFQEALTADAFSDIPATGRLIAVDELGDTVMALLLQKAL